MAEIPEDLKQRYERLITYTPMEQAVTDIRVAEWIALIERIASLTADLAAAKEQVARLSAPVSDEEWGETKLLVLEGNDRYDLATRSEMDDIIAARVAAGKEQV